MPRFQLRKGAMGSRGGHRPGAGRKALPKGRRRSVRVALSLTQSEARSLLGAAKRAGQSRSAYARDILVRHLRETTHADAE